MKYFKSKKAKKRSKIFWVLFLGTVSFAVSLSFFSSWFHNNQVLNFFIRSTFPGNTRVTEQTTLLDFLLNYTIGSQEITKEEDRNNDPSKGEYIEDPSPEENKKEPIVYLYNSHQTEEYVNDSENEYNKIPTVMLSSYKLREELNKKGIPTMVETNSISEIIHANNWDYEYSYVASKMLMTSALEQNPSLEYFIDLHRDALPYDISYLEQNGRRYAKIMFVIGIDHEHYEENLALANRVNDLLNEKMPGLSRGVLTKGGSGPKAIFNQNFSTKTILIEIGGQYNKISEVTNTVMILADVLESIIR